ncbi:hypothetical protein BDZ97DRAFT_1846950 [Flammula alnicola]|nr:hypothetical protein BDZ97DRAFT_1846950 [Flammula alnicola]
MSSTPAPISSTSTTIPSTSPPTTSSSPPKRRKVKYAKAFGYLLDPNLVYQQAIKDGTAIEDQFGRTFATYRNRLARHCGIKYDDMITIRNPNPDMPPIYCVVAATNLSKRSRIPREDIIEKAKEFLGTTEEPKWYYMIRV